MLAPEVNAHNSHHFCFTIWSNIGQRAAGIFKTAGASLEMEP